MVLLVLYVSLLVLGLVLLVLHVSLQKDDFVAGRDVGRVQQGHREAQEAKIYVFMREDQEQEIISEDGG